jgi:hypothetical protein
MYSEILCGLNRLWEDCGTRIETHFFPTQMINNIPCNLQSITTDTN